MIGILFCSSDLERVTEFLWMAGVCGEVDGYLL